MAYQLNETIYNNNIEELEQLLIDGVDPNDLSGSESPLKTVIQENAKPEELELLLDYGADPNIEEGSGITVFTDIIFLILSSITGRNPDEEPEYFIPYLQLLLNYGVDMNKSEPGHPSPIRAIRDWPTDYSHNVAWYRNRGIMSNPDSNDIWASEQLNKIIQDILDEQEKYKTYLARQRLSLGKTGLPQNVMDSIMGNLDNDTFNVVGENMLEDQYYYDNDSMNRYYPDETYSEYRRALYGDESDDRVRRKTNRRKKKTKKKHKKKWGKAKRGGNRSDLETDEQLIQGMDRIPYGIRNSHQIANEFIKAVVKNDKRRIRQLLLLGADINSHNVNRMTALHSAIFITKNIDMVKFLLNNGSNPDINYNEIPIINRLMKTNMDVYTKKKIIELLIQYGAPLNLYYQQRWFGDDVTRLTDDEKDYLTMVEQKNRDRQLKRLNFSKLMSNRLGENALQPEEGENIDRIGKMIDQAEETKRDEELRGELISEYLQSIQSGGNDTNFQQQFKKVLDKQSFNDMKNDRGVSILLLCCLLGKIDVVETMLKNGSDPNTVTNNGLPILLGVCLIVKNPLQKLCLCQLLINHGADIHIDVQGTPLINVSELSEKDKQCLQEFDSTYIKRQNNSKDINYTKQNTMILENMFLKYFK